MSEEPRFHTNENGRLIFDNDFTYDAMFILDGDFESDDARIAYTAKIVDALNRRAGKDYVLDKRLPCDFYLAPLPARPPRTPLTEFQRMQIIGDEFPLALVDPLVIAKIDAVCLAIEAAHGIASEGGAT